MAQASHVVLDSSNLEAIIADATGEKLEKPAEPEKAAVTAPEVPEAAKPADPDPDDVEGDDGLTPRQKRDYTAQMLKSLGRKHRQLKEAEDFAAAQYSQRKLADKRAEELVRENARLKTEADKAKVVDPEAGKPQREAFESDEKFRSAEVQWLVAKGIREEREKEALERETARQAQVLATARERIAKASELVPDFTEVLEGATDEVPPTVAAYMQESEMFAELGYHLAQHPEVLERISKYSPAKQLVEIGKIESTLQPFSSRTAAGQDEKALNGASSPSHETGSPPAPNAAEGSGKGPSPETGSPEAGPSKPRAPVIKPLTAGSASQLDKPVSEMTYEESRAAWAKKHHINLDRRKRH